MQTIYLNESTAARRRVKMRLVQASDGKSAATSTQVTAGVAQLSANGGTPTNSTNSITEISSTNAPGWWYIELTASELATLGVGNHHVRFKEADTLESVGGEFQVVPDDIWTAGLTVGAIADAVWDETTSGHVAAGSFGQALNSVRAGTAQAGSSSTITLDAAASATDDFYNNCLLFITGGAGAGQARMISDYVGASKVATVGQNWTTSPDSTSAFVILPFSAIRLSVMVG